MRGYRTILINAGIAAATAGVGYLANIDWASVDPRAAIVAPGLVALLNIGLRMITSTPVGKAN